MLQYKILKNNSGLVVIGHYSDLDALNDVVHEIDTASPLCKGGDLLMMLAAEARKSTEKRRKVYKSPKYYPEIGPRYGFKVMWPVLIAQLRMLRESLAFMNSTRHQQSVVYGLESLVEAAIKSAFPNISVELADVADKLCARHTHFENRVYPRCALFCDWNKTERAKNIVHLIASMDVAYDIRYTHVTEEAKEELGYLSAELFAPYEGREWGDPNW